MAPEPVRYGSGWRWAASQVVPTNVASTPGSGGAATPHRQDHTPANDHSILVDIVLARTLEEESVGVGEVHRFPVGRRGWVGLLWYHLMRLFLPLDSRVGGRDDRPLQGLEW